MKNLKKVVSSVAALAIVASSVSAFAIKFPDVDSSASYANAVDTLVALGIVKGDDQGMFNPDAGVTRAEFTKMAVGALGELASAESQTTSKFADAANTSVHWAAGYIAQGVADGFINGYDENTFGPNDSVTYNQACKMLVAAVGYELYAQRAGGWPTGYTSQASSLGISKGVSPSAEDAALTRAQCAVMIYNALQVPLNVIDGWDTTVLGDSTPIYKKLDGKENRDYQTLLTDRHDAYVVKGRVTANYQGSTGLEKDEVKYDVEVSDNYDDELDIKKGNTRDSQTFKVGETDAANMLFAYTEAIVQKDKDSDEFTLLSIVNYGNAKIVEFKADDLSDDDDAILKDDKSDVDYVGKGKLAVLKGANTSATTKYDLAKDAKLYVNGVDAGSVTNDLIKKYILANPTGTVQIVDQTEVGSTSTDGKYDKIMVTFFVDAVVEDVQKTSSYARVNFKASQIKAMKMEWDPDDADIEVKFATVDGTPVNYEDLEENDVLSIQYDMYTEKTNADSLTNKDFYNVIVSKNVVEGNLTNRDSDDETITVNGSEYDLVCNDSKYDSIAVTQTMQDTGMYELNTEYKLYLDAFGYVAHKDDGSSDKNYGVIVAMYQGSGNEHLSVRMITSDAKVVAYECKDTDAEKQFYNYAKTQNENGDETAKEFKKGDEPFKSQIKAGKTVCTYTLSGGKIKFKKAYKEQGNEKLEYKANSQKIGSYSISDTATKIIDMDDYMNGSDSTVKTLSVNSFEDEAEYTAFFYDKNSDSVYRFAIVLYGTSSIRAESQLAVVKKFNGQTDTDGKTCWTYTVLRAGEEVEVLVDDSAAQQSEGAVIAYTLNSDGYVDSKDIYVLYTPDADYDTTRENILANDLFGKALNYVVAKTTDTADRDYGKYEIEYKSGEKSTTKKVYAYAGIVYKKSGNNLELFIKKTGKISDITKTDVADLSLAGANVYLYDYSYQAKKGSRVSVGTATQSDTVYNSTYDDGDKTQVNWDKVKDNGKTPLLAFVKEVDGDVTDCLLIQSK